jgi:hypothetical protein
VRLGDCAGRELDQGPFHAQLNSLMPIVASHGRCILLSKLFY